MIYLRPPQVQANTSSGQSFSSSNKSNKKRVEVKDYILPNGTVYTGELLNGEFNGFGSVKYPNNERYEGTFLNGKKNGKGKYYYKSGEYYIGDWVNNKKQGSGLYIYDKDKWYEGQFKNSKKHGKGIIKQTNGNYYSGYFFENHKDKEGLYYNFAEDKITKFMFNKGVQLDITEVPSQEQIEKLKKQNIIPSFVTQKSLIEPSSQRIVSQILQNYLNYQKQTIPENPNTAHISLHYSNQRVNSNQYLKRREETIFSQGPQIKNEKLKGIKIVDWQIDQICEWLGEIGFGDFVTEFRHQNITGLGLINLNQENLKELNIVSEQDRRVFLMQIKFLKLFLKTQCLNQEIFNVRHQDFDLGLLYKLSKHEGIFMKKHQSYIQDIHLFLNQNNSHKLKSFNSLKKQNYEPKKLQVQKKQEPSAASQLFSSHQAEDGFSNSTQSSVQQGQDRKQTSQKQDVLNTKKNRKRHSQIHRQIQLEMKRKRIDTKFVIPNSQIQIKKSIGKGSYGQVYLAAWIGQQVAVKLYTKRKGIRNRHISRFLEEAQITIKLLHPFIVLYMGIFVFDNDYALVMQYMQGGSLFDYLHIKGYKPSEGKIINICKKIALGMTYLHGKKIIHCDLKSSNLLLDQYEKVKISDFGLSQIKRENSKKKCRSTRLGTPHWMAPQVMKFGIYDYPSDVYSFGVILWQLLSGQIPFREMTEKQVVKQANKPQGLSLKVPNSQNQKLVSLFISCTKKQASERPSFNQIVNYLSKLQAVGSEIYVK